MGSRIRGAYKDNYPYSDSQLLVELWSKAPQLDLNKGLGFRVQRDIGN